MDREQFLHSIKSDNMEVSDIVVNFFDQYMLLYDLIDSVINTSIISSDQSTISFQLDLADEESTTTLRNKLAAIPAATIFDSFYNIFFEVVSKESIVIKFVR